MFFGHPYLAPRHHAEHVLHAERDPSPVVGFDLGHGNQEIRLQHSAREPEVPHFHVALAQWCANQFVAIEIDESDLLVSERFLISALGENQLCVPLMSWPLGHDH